MNRVIDFANLLAKFPISTACNTDGQSHFFVDERSPTPPIPSSNIVKGDIFVVGVELC